MLNGGLEEAATSIDGQHRFGWACSAVLSVGFPRPVHGLPKCASRGVEMLHNRFIVQECDQGGKSRTNRFRNLAQPILQGQRTGGRAGQQRENIGGDGSNMRFPRTRFDLWYITRHKPIHGTSLELNTNSDSRILVLPEL